MTMAIQCIINSYLAFCIFHFFSMTLLQLGVSLKNSQGMEIKQ